MEVVAVGVHLLPADEAGLGEGATTGEVMIVATLLEAVIVEDTEVDLEVMRHTERFNLCKG